MSSCQCSNDIRYQLLFTFQCIHIPVQDPETISQSHGMPRQANQSVASAFREEHLQNCEKYQANSSASGQIDGLKPNSNPESIPTIPLTPQKKHSIDLDRALATYMSATPIYTPQSTLFPTVFPSITPNLYRTNP